MYQHEWLTLPNFIAHDWPAYRGEKTLTDVARSVVNEWDIGDGDILVGSSLGGMVACEITKIRRIPHLFLVGSAIDRSEIARMFAITYPLINLMPVALMTRVASVFNNDLLQMFSRADSTFIRQMCTAIFHWEGLGVTASKIHRIHGKYDWVISSPRHVDLLLDGGHLIAMTHARECIGCLSRFVLL